MTEHDERAGPDAAPDDALEQVEEQLAQIQQRHRGKIRWRITKHTAELAIRALNEATAERAPGRRGGKSRRRKRKKRLL